MAISQPVRASVRRRRVCTSTAAPPTSAKPSSQPAWPPSAWLSSRSMPGSPPNRPPPPPPPGPRRRHPGRRSVRTGGRGRCSRRSATRCCCRSVPEIHGPARRGREPHQQRPGEPADEQRRAAGEQLRARQPSRRAARPTARRRRSPGTISSAAAIFVSKPRPIARPAARPASACGRPRAPRTDEPQRGDRAEDQQRVRVVVPRDRDGHRRQREREAAGEARPRGRSAGASGRRSGRRSRCPSAPAARACSSELKPNARTDSAWTQSASGGLSTVISAAGVERAVEEVVPAAGHRADGGGVVLVGVAVLAEAPEVEHGGQQRAGRSAPGCGRAIAKRARARRVSAGRGGKRHVRRLTS